MDITKRRRPPDHHHERTLPESLDGLRDEVHELNKGMDLDRKERLGSGPVTKDDLHKIEKLINMKTSELATQLTNIKAQLDKSKDEVLKRIADLEAALSNTELPPDADAAIDALKASVQVVDDINPDVPPTT